MSCRAVKFSEEKSFQFLLESWVLVVVRMSVGRMLQAAGPATLNARLPNFSDVRGMTKALLSADRRLQCLVVTGCSSSAT